MVFIPTRLKGFDVTYFSLVRQKCPGINLIACTADEHVESRGAMLADKFERAGINYVTFKMSHNPGYERNLAASYKQAMQFAREIGVDGFVSLQDYIWVPEDGIAKFVEVSDKIEDPHILTGICHITSDPDPSRVVDIEDDFTIFAEPYSQEPQEIAWYDVRKENAEARLEEGVHVTETFPVEWEANWAYIPKEALYDEDLEYDEIFDKWVAYENQDYAFQAVNKGYKVILDTENEVKSLPHKKYWHELESYEAPLTLHNKEIIEERYE